MLQQQDTALLSHQLATLHNTGHLITQPLSLRLQSEGPISQPHPALELCSEEKCLLDSIVAAMDRIVRSGKLSWKR